MVMSDDCHMPRRIRQHWLEDSESLRAMVGAAEVEPGDAVLEIGPGYAV